MQQEPIPNFSVLFIFGVTLSAFGMMLLINA
jgi:hypothetical protein